MKKVCLLSLIPLLTSCFNAPNTDKTNYFTKIYLLASSLCFKAASSKEAF